MRILDVYMTGRRGLPTALLLVAAILFTPMAGAVETAPAQKSALTVVGVAPQTENWPQVVAAAGEVTAWQESVIGSELGQQRIVEVNVEVGSKVRKGAVLARIADSTVAAELAQAEAALAEADAMLAEARSNAERARSLREKGFYSPQQGIQFKTAQTTALARKNAAAAAVQGARVRLLQTRIVAPDDGVISVRAASVGSMTTPGQELFRLIRQSRLEWRAEVAEVNLAQIRPGMLAHITTVAGDIVEGRVRMVAPHIDPRTRNALVYVDLPKPGSAARAGMFVRGEIEVATGAVLTIPQTAVVLRDGFAYVFQLSQVGAGGTANVAMRKIELGTRQGARVVVKSGLEKDARVVATGGGFLADGDSVRFAPSPANAAEPAAGKQ